MRRIVLGEAARWRSSWEMPEKRRSSIGPFKCDLFLAASLHVHELVHAR